MSDNGNPSDTEQSPTIGDETPADASEENETMDEVVAEEEFGEEQLGEGELGHDDIEDSTPEEEVVEEPVPKKKRNLIKRVMEYDVSEMYPELSVLTDKKKREWDYQDPETIRALWLESKTNALSEWKIKYLTIKKNKKPQIEVRDTTAVTLRIEHLKNKEEIQKTAEAKDLLIIEKGRESPKFDEVKLPTNTTTDMRYKYTRNNPPVPRYYLEHFEKHKKPPFKIQGIASVGCKPL